MLHSFKRRRFAVSSETLVLELLSFLALILLTEAKPLLSATAPSLGLGPASQIHGIQNTSVLHPSSTNSSTTAADSRITQYAIVRTTFIKAITVTDVVLHQWDHILERSKVMLQEDASDYVGGEHAEIPGGHWSTDLGGTRFAIKASEEELPVMPLTFGVAMDVCQGLRDLGAALGYRQVFVRVWSGAWDLRAADAAVGPIIGESEGAGGDSTAAS